MQCCREIRRLEVDLVDDLAPNHHMGDLEHLVPQYVVVQRPSNVPPLKVVIPCFYRSTLRLDEQMFELSIGEWLVHVYLYQNLLGRDH